MSDRVAPQSLAEMHERLAAGHTTLEEELSCLLARVGSQEKKIHALVNDESAAERKKRIFAAAADLEQRWPDSGDRPPLFGALVGIKDLFHVTGFPTRGGSALPAEVFEEAGAPGAPAQGAHEAATVSALREAGAIVLGKTVSTEFAYFAPGPTRNPWNPEHTPGGSSSGSAAAVASGMCHLAMGTQTIGSITRPASFCGVTGYKPSFGRVSTDGVIPFSPDADHIGPIAADVDTLALAAGVLVSDWRGLSPQPTRPAAGISAVPEHPDFRHSFGPVLVPDDAYTDQADDSGRAALEGIIERLTGLGVVVQRVGIFDDIDAINRAHQAMIARDFAEIHADWADRYRDRYHQRSLELIDRGSGVSDAERETARQGRFELRHRLNETLERHGARLWLAPATVGEAPHGIEGTGDPIMNLPWTYAGVPTVSISAAGLPHGRGPHGLPLGVQCAGPFGADEALLDQIRVMERFV
ncbi:MAG TPA: amidase [Alkalispirochaeta sp.]|nr:amidase [Alkalispirochaeta sp.]